jgi:hypothetical protein
MIRRIALALILALLTQSLLPGVALALRADDAGPRTLVICTGDGIKTIVLDPGADPTPQAAHTCPCGVLCAGGTLPCCERRAVRVVYAEQVRFAPPDAVLPIAAHAPPRQQVRAPPSSS